LRGSSNFLSDVIFSTALWTWDRGVAVPALYLDLGFVANLADVALRFIQIAREFEGTGKTDSRRLHL
jgi:hypothetical protein